MGNREQYYIIGATISAIAVVLAFASLIPTLQETTTSSTALNALGHATVIMTNPEGDIIYYAQADNFVVNSVLNNIQQLLFEKAGAGIDAKWLALCEAGPTVLRTATSCLGNEMDQKRADGDTGGGAGATAKASGGAGVTTNTLQKTITITASDAAVTFTELGLFSDSAGANAVAIALLNPAITPALGADVGLTYTVTIGGG